MLTDAVQEDAPAGQSRKPRLRRRILIALAALLVLTLAAFGGLGWYYSSQLLDPEHHEIDYSATLVAAAPGTVTLTGHGADHAGVQGLIWREGEARLGPVLRKDGDRVERTLLSGTAPAPGTKVHVDQGVTRRDPKAGLGLEFEQVSIDTPLGPAPAWLVPAPPIDTWVIAVHGRGSNRFEALRTLPPLHRLGLPVLDISYRNDTEAPASPDGFYHLGDAEWQDVEAAIRYAQRRGAAHVVLYGSSMGGAIVGQVLAQSGLAGVVSAVVLDAPVTSWDKTLDLQSGNRGFPGWFGSIAELFAHWRAGVEFDRMELAEHPPKAKPPTLLLHGDADSTVPVQASRDLAAAAPGLGWPLTYVEFPGAEHTASWNVDPARYETEVTRFLSGALRLPVPR